ncbi:MAG: hypothetical protein KJ754_13385 [Bacteroidetes bacterium]|nr:hypothetical protein [Bacteroidota bacterium]
MESLFWGEAFKAVDINEFIRIFLRFLITFSLFTGFLSLLSKKISSNDHVPKQLINYPQLAAKIFVIGLIYFIVYNLFGYFIAWQFEATRVFYTGVIEKLDFFEAMWQNISNPAFVFVHIFRGILFGFAGYMFHKILKCSRSKKALIMALIFGGFGFQIVLPNPLLPEMVRISHFIETTTSMLLFGAIVSLVYSYKKSINLPAVLLLAFLVSSCQKEPIRRFGFDTDFGKNSQGLTIMHIGCCADTIKLTGEYSMAEGKVLIELIDPTGETVFSSYYNFPGSLQVNESFSAISGNWKLKYKSLEGEGSISLHLSINTSKEAGY